MIIKMVCWMKSGVKIEESINFIGEVTIEDAENFREKMNGLIRNAIRRKDSGTINFGFASFNISEIAAYRMTIEDVEE